MANSNGWGDGASNNDIGWGQGANNSTGWGKSHLNSWSGATDIDGGNPPVNSVAPALSGTAQEGQTLTCSTGTWSGSPTYTYQWKRDGNNITSATNSTYTLVTADVGTSIKCTVTATNFTGSATADSNTVVPVSAFTGLLDTYSGASAAYSLRQLSSTYTGNCIRVRRSSDNTEQNIGFVNNVLDEASLLTFCGAGNGFVTTWYDQSGNAKNATQSTAASQPQIVTSGVVNKIGSLPVMNTLNKDLVNTQTNSTTQATFSVFQNETTGSAFLYGLPMTIVSSGVYGGICQSGSSAVPYGDGTNFGTPTYFKNGSSITATRGALFTAFATGNKSVLSMMGGGTIATNRQLQYPGLSGNIKTFEVIIYNTSQTSNRTGIESNINTFYTIY